MRIVVAYEGTRYSGWQLQAGVPTVQGVLEEAIGRIEGQPVRVRGASRTDAGVHALGQVAQADTLRALDPERYRRALNGVLPPDVRVRLCDLVSQPFLPMHGVIEKTYEYLVDPATVPSPLTRRFAWHLHPGPDLALLRAELASVVGTRDFDHLSSAGGGHASGVRELRAAEALMRPDGLLAIRLTANGFLYHLARNIVSIAASVACGGASSGELLRVLRDEPPATGIKPAPAQGLTLLGIQYDDPFALDSRSFV